MCLLPDGVSASCANSPQGIVDCLALLNSFEGIERLVLEPTEGYERLVVDAFLASGLPVAKINAKQVRQFARACGQLSKIDNIDAFILTDYGRRMETRLLKAKNEQQEQLADLVTRYR